MEFPKEKKEETYRSLLPQIEALVEGEADLTANMANVCALLHTTFGFWWTGFYRVMGACLVLSRDFIRRRETLFDPATFLYYEEYLLYNACMRGGLRVVYRPAIRVAHLGGASTVTLSTGLRDRYRRMVRNTLAAAKIYRQDLDRHAGGKAGAK